MSSDVSWPLVPLREVINVVDYVANGSFASLKANVVYRHAPDYAILVRLVDFNSGWQGERVYVDERAYRFLGKSSLEPGDVLVANVGANAGTVFKVPDLGQPMTLGPNAVVLKPRELSKLDRRFVYYYLCGPAGQEAIQSIIAGSAQPKFNKTDVRRLPFPVPPMAVQKRIADTLGALDDKVQLNRHMIRTLESTARAIFKSWFVDFDPVRKKKEGGEVGLPSDLAALSPSDLVASDGGEVPASWPVRKLGDIAVQVRLHVRPEELQAGTPYFGLEHLPRRSIALGDWGVADRVASGKSRFAKGDYLFGKLRPYFHKVGPAPVDGVCSTDIVVIRPRRPDLGAFVLGHLSSDDFVDYAAAGSSGTRMPRTSWKDMAAYPLVVPPDQALRAYQATVSPLLRQIQSSILESRTLVEARDQLLPQLLAGRLHAPGA